MNKLNLFRHQIGCTSAAQTVSPFIHGKPPVRDAARWAKTPRHKYRRTGFESVWTMPDCPVARPVKRSLTGLPEFQHSSDSDSCFHLILLRGGFSNPPMIHYPSKWFMEKGHTLSAVGAHCDAALSRWFPWITGANCLSG